MCFAKKNQEGAISLLEMMFVMVVIATIMIAATRQIQANALKYNAVVISGSVRTLFNALQEYYYQNCLTLGYGTNTITMSQLQTANLLTDQNNIIDPLGGNIANYTMTVSWNVTSGTWILTVTYTLPSSLSQTGKIGGGSPAQSYIALLNPSSVAENVLKWQEAVGTNLANKNTMVSQLSTNASLYALAWYVDPSAPENQYTGYYSSNSIPQTNGNAVQSCFVRDRLEFHKEHSAP